jgi:5-methylcytosine-specific restriction endonuclease McrA
MRKLVLERAGYMCKKCGSEFHLEVHHKRYRVPCRLSDFEVLCEECHRKAHEDTIIFLPKGWILDEIEKMEE